MKYKNVEICDGKMPWEYDINDMRVLCRTCHQKVHKH